MKFSEDYNPSANVINAYSDTEIIINRRPFTQSLIVSNFALIEDWPLQHIDELGPELLQPMLELQPEVILIGTGQNIQFPHPGTYASVINQGIGIEFMDSGAACRTYNILLSEERRVVAGIVLGSLLSSAS